MDSKLLIVDGHAYAYRAFHAIRSLSSPAGQPTNAIYGFIKMLGRIQSQIRPTHQVVVWDGGLAAERVAALPEYKSQRPPMPDDLEAQLGEIQQYLSASSLATIQQEGVEADDTIALLTQRAVQAGWFVVIASSDKDFMQLVGPRVGLWNPNDKTERIWNSADVEAKTGVAPEQIVDWLSLVGDSVDNIPGVPGVGGKTAAQLLRQFGSIEAMQDRLAEIPSERVRQRVQASWETLKRNQELVRLNLKTKLDCGLSELAMRSPDTDRLRLLYSKWGFKTLLAQLSETPFLL